MMTTGITTTGPTTGVDTTETAGETTGGMTTGETTDATAGETGETTGGVMPMASTHRFDCLDVIDLGDSNGDGQPDGGAIQALLLENTWSSDIQAYRLSIMLSLLSSDAASGMAELMVSSGIGATDEELCAEPTTMSPAVTGSYDPALAAWQPVDAAGMCAEPTAGGATGGTYTLALGTQDTIYVYAQEADGTVLNCTPGAGGPDAVPLHAVQASLTVSADGQTAAGELNGCLLASEAADLCSCLSDCSGAGHPDCGGCPNGSVPLGSLLGGVGATANCSGLMGEDAYDLRVRFSTQALGFAEPMVCGA